MIGRSDYAARREARVTGLEKRAAKTAAKSEAALGKARRIADGIPFGQPILVGHHSEARARRDIAKIDSNMRKGVELGAESERLAARAAAAESNTAISSDDPEALVSLRAKVAKLEIRATEMKRVNQVIRKARVHTVADPKRAIAEALVAELGWKPGTAAQAAEPDCFGHYGFAAYQLSGNSAEVRRCKRRIAELEARSVKADEAREQTIGDIAIAWKDNRVQLLFPDKPAEAIRANLKSKGFRFAPSSGAWQRMANEGAWRLALSLANQVSK